MSRPANRLRYYFKMTYTLLLIQLKNLNFQSSLKILLIQKHIHTSLLTATLFVIVEHWKPPKYRSQNTGNVEFTVTHPQMEYYEAVKKKNNTEGHLGGSVY